MSDTLARIVAGKRAEVARRRVARPFGAVERAATFAATPRGFATALERVVVAGRYGLIAEIKKASPSKGLIRADFDPPALARAYAEGGAACLSVLTDEPWFQGQDEHLVAARAAVALPVLRKDFMIDPYQVYEARSWGADCILLIVDAAADEELRALEDVARDLGMDVLVECHNASQLERALAAFASPLIGVNNRDLTTFETRLDTTLELAKGFPENRLLVTESGIHHPSDVARLQAAKVSAYLVGSAFMSAKDPGKELQRVFSGA